MKLEFGLCLALGIGGATSFAGHTVGNGGDAVVCYDDSGDVTGVEILDFYEGRILRGLVPDLGGASLDVEDKVAKAIDRLHRLDTSRESEYRAWADEFFSEVTFVDVDLVDVPDHGDLPVQPSCAIEQLAIRRTPELPYDPRYIINERLWNALDSNNKAGLVLHELIYREAVEVRELTNSIGSRYFTSILASNKFDLLTSDQYEDMLRIIYFNHVVVSDVYIYTKSLPLRTAISECSRLDAFLPGQEWEFESHLERLLHAGHEITDLFENKNFWGAYVYSAADERWYALSYFIEPGWDFQESYEEFEVESSMSAQFICVKRD